MGCGASKDIHIDGIDVPWTESGYPPPKPPASRRQDVFDENQCADIEAHAKQAPYSAGSSYETLLSYLLTDETKTGVQKVRAIYCWLAAQSPQTMVFDKDIKDAYSPNGYMKTIQQGNGNYSAFFALLCRAAEIPCVILQGKGKAAGYEVGQQDMSDLHSSWTAVYVDGSWRLVHVFWALTGLLGFNQGGWTKVEESGVAVRQKEKASGGVTVNTQDDFWFLVDPDHLVYLCLADKPEWQLMKQPWSLHKFVNVPHFHDPYFHSPFKLHSTEAAILKSEKGTTTITFKHEKNFEAQPLQYSLLFDEQNSQDQIPQSLQLEQYVVGSNEDLPGKSLTVRFPVRGIYKIKIMGHDSTRRIPLASFRLECSGVLKNVQPYPINPKIGFGYTKETKDVGLTNPSQIKGILVVRVKQKVVFKFQCVSKVELQTLLVHKDLGSQDLESYVEQNRTEKNVSITVTVPPHAQNPEYALQVNARPEGSTGPYDNVVNYLLTHGNQTMEGEKEPQVDESEREKLREELKAAIKSGDIARLENALRKCERANLTDEDSASDMDTARDILLELHEQALRTATEKRNLKALEKAIDGAKRSRVANDIMSREAYSEAERLRDLLRRLEKYLPDILAMKQPTVSEIHSYKRPKPLVHQVMIATYMLLGEKEKELKKWHYVQNLLRKLGKESIINRIKQFDLISLRLRTVTRAETKLNQYSKDDVRLVSAGAGTFFVWSHNIIKEGKENSSESLRNE